MEEVSADELKAVCQELDSLLVTYMECLERYQTLQTKSTGHIKSVRFLLNFIPSRCSPLGYFELRNRRISESVCFCPGHLFKSCQLHSFARILFLCRSH